MRSRGGGGARLDASHHSVAVYFDTRAAAEAFLALYPHGSVGVAPVALLCLD